MKNASNKKILFVFPVDTTLRRGDATHVREFVFNMQPVYENAKFITYDPYRKKNKFYKILNFRFDILKSIFSKQYNIIYFRYYPSFFVEIFFLFLFKQKYFIELNAVIVDEMVDLKRGFFMRTVQYLDEFFFTKTAEQLICVTPEIANYYSSFSRKKPIVINNGANTDIFNPHIVFNSSLISRYKNYFTIGFVGSLSPWQDFETLIRAISELKDRGYGNQIVCLIVGSGVQENFIREMIEKMSVDDSIKLLGSVSYNEVPSIMNLFSITVAPLRGSRLKKTGSAALKVFEYLAMNKRVVITKVGHLSELIEKNGFGSSFDAENFNQLADIIEDEINKNSDEVFANSRQFVIDHYSWKSKIDKLKSIINKY